VVRDRRRVLLLDLTLEVQRRGAEAQLVGERTRGRGCEVTRDLGLSGRDD